MIKPLPLSIPDVLLFENEIRSDHRGFFEETFRLDDYNLPQFVQENHSRSCQRVVRGLHYEEPYCAKLVRCIRGEILDVVVDIRPDSPTYLQWVSAYLNDLTGHSIYIPEGFCHGFLTISYEADVCYKVSTYYKAENQRAIKWNDPKLNINWGIDESQVIVSDADRRAVNL